MIIASWANPVEVAVARCSVPSGTTDGSSAAIAGLSNEVAMPTTVIAMKICGTVSQPP